MQEIGAHFFATGEVCGQRPMSQGMQTMMLIENQAEVDGVVLRPLSAKLLPPTNAEKNGWIKRENMLDIKGRGRKIQLAYALQHGLHHDTPAGGCLLTQRYTTLRLQDLLTHNPGFSLDDLRLIAYGRIFRINRQCIFVLGRHHDDNQRIINLFRPSDLRLQLDGEEGPLGLVRGHASEDERKNMARILARFSKARDATQTAVVLIDGETRTRYDVTPAALHEFDHLRVTDRDE